MVHGEYAGCSKMTSLFLVVEFWKYLCALGNMHAGIHKQADFEDSFYEE